MKIQPMNHHQNTYLISLAEKNASEKNGTVKSKLLSSDNQAMDLSISKEGKAALKDSKR